MRRSATLKLFQKQTIPCDDDLDPICCCMHHVCTCTCSAAAHLMQPPPSVAVFCEASRTTDRARLTWAPALLSQSWTNFPRDDRRKPCSSAGLLPRICKHDSSSCKAAAFERGEVYWLSRPHRSKRGIHLHLPETNKPTTCYQDFTIWKTEAPFLVLSGNGPFKAAHQTIPQT
jgi:hypothetical protein